MATLHHTWKYYVHSGPRTSNHLEAPHNQLKRISRTAHPNFYEILELFQREQAATEVTIQQFEAGRMRRPKWKKVVQLEEKVKSLAEELTKGDRDIDSYLTDIVWYLLILVS